MKIFLFIVLIFSACALPTQDVEPNLGIDRRELRAISLAREGLVAFSKSRYQEAEIRFREALYFEPNSLTIKVDLASALKQLALYAESESLYLEALSSLEQHELPRVEKKKKEVEIKLALASLYYDSDKIDQARGLWQEALKLSLNNKQEDLVIFPIDKIFQNLAVLEFLEGNQSEALCYYMELDNLKNSEADKLKLARILMSFGYASRSLNIVRNIVEQQEKPSPDAWLQFAYSSIELEDLNSAKLAHENLSMATSARTDLLLYQDMLADFFSDRIEGYEESLVAKSKVSKDSEDLEEKLEKELELKNTIESANQRILASDESLYFPIAMLDHMRENLPKETDE